MTAEEIVRRLDRLIKANDDALDALGDEARDRQRLLEVLLDDLSDLRDEVHSG